MLSFKGIVHQKILFFYLLRSQIVTNLYDLLPFFSLEERMPYSFVAIWVRVNTDRIAIFSELSF